MSKLPTHTTSPQKLAMLAQVLQQYPGSRSDSQRQRIMAALAQAACTSNELQRHLDCYDCNARINELRHQDGHQISMSWVQQETEAGELHRVGMFFLDREGGNHAQA